MTEVKEQQQEVVRAGPVAWPRSVPPVVWYLIAAAVLVSITAVDVAIRGRHGELGLTTPLLCLLTLTLVVGPWVHKRTPARQRVILRMAENNSAVVLVSLATVTWLGWGEVPPILAGVLGAAPPVIGLWGLHALRKAAA